MSDWLAANVEGYQPIVGEGYPDDHAWNAMVIISHILRKYVTDIPDIISDFTRTVPWALTCQCAWPDWNWDAVNDPPPQAPPLTNVRLFVSFAQPTWWDRHAYGFERGVHLHLYMAIDGPITDRLLVWGCRTDPLSISPEDSGLHKLTVGFHEHLLKVWGSESADWKDGKGVDSWLLKNPFELVWEFEVKKADDYSLPEPVLVSEVGVEHPEPEVSLKYVGLRPTGFDKPLGVMTSKGQAARAAREVLRHILLHCRTDLAQKVPVLEGMDPGEVFGAPWLDMVCSSVAPDIYTSKLLLTPFPMFFPFTQMFNGMVDLYDFGYERGGGRARIQPKLTLIPKPDKEGYMNIPVLWPAGWDGHVQGCDPEQVPNPDLINPIAGYGQGEPFVRFYLRVDHDTLLHDIPPPGQFFPVFSDNFCTPVDCVFVYRLITGEWLRWESLEEIDLKWYLKGTEWSDDENPFKDNTYWAYHRALTFQRLQAAGWLWDDSLLPGWEEAMDAMIASGGNDPTPFQPFASQINNLWNKLNDLAFWQGYVGNSQFVSDILGKGKRLDRVALRIAPGNPPTTVLGCTGGAGVCFAFPTAAACGAQGTVPHIVDEDEDGLPGNQPIDDGYWLTDGQEMSISPFSWPTSSAWQAFCGLRFESLYWTCASPIPGTAVVFTCADVQAGEFIGGLSLGAIGFGFLPSLLP